MPSRIVHARDRAGQKAARHAPGHADARGDEWRTRAFKTARVRESVGIAIGPQQAGGRWRRRRQRTTGQNPA